MVGVLLSKTLGTSTLYHSFFMKGWPLQPLDSESGARGRADRYENQNAAFVCTQDERRKSGSLVDHLQLLFGSLLFEVSWVLTGSHVLKFRSNTQKRCSL